jgi:hypothetical protein
VNKLYEVIGELAEHEENGLQVPRFNAKEHYLNLKRINNTENKASSGKALDVKRLQSFTYNPKENEPSQRNPEKIESGE